MDLEKIKALIDVASKATDNPDALDGAVDLQKLLQEDEARRVQLEALQAQYDKEMAEKNDRITRLTGDLAHFIKQAGVPSEQAQNKKTDRAELYRKFQNGQL